MTQIVACNRVVQGCKAKAVPEAVRLIVSGKWQRRRKASKTATSGVDTKAQGAAPLTKIVTDTSGAVCPSKCLAGDAARYDQRGVSADEGDVHAAINETGTKASCRMRSAK